MPTPANLKVQAHFRQNRLNHRLRHSAFFGYSRPMSSLIAYIVDNLSGTLNIVSSSYLEKIAALYVVKLVIYRHLVLIGPATGGIICKADIISR